MKYLHFFPYEKFTTPFIKFINNNYNSKDHLFFLYGDRGNYSVESADNIIYFEKNLKSQMILVKYLFKSKKIIMHSLDGYLILILSLLPSLLKKSYWIVWGEDLYGFNKEADNFKIKLTNSVKEFAINRMKGICTLVKGDFDVATKKFRIRGKYYPAAYINPIKTDYLDNVSSRKKKSKESLNVLIGNSANISNKHDEVLELLAKYKNKNLRISVPISYAGTEDYIEFVKKIGNELFGAKFIPISDFMTPTEYVDFLSEIDIAIFANERQQALGNIFALVYLEKKVYIRSDISTWEYLVGDIGIVLSDYKNIKNEGFEQFSMIKTENNNKQNIVKVMDENEIKKKWDIIFK